MNGTDRNKLADVLASNVAAAAAAAAPEKPKVNLPRLRARALHAFAGSAYDPQVLAFDVGDIVLVESQSETGWWKGTLEKNGVTGDFKATYFEIIQEQRVGIPAATPTTIPATIPENLAPRKLFEPASQTDNHSGLLLRYYFFLSFSTGLNFSLLLLCSRKGESNSVKSKCTGRPAR